MGAAIGPAVGLIGGIAGMASGAGNTGLASTPQIEQQKNLLGAIDTANQYVGSNIANQNAFARALLAQTQGAGPNLAAAQLANATGQNVANQAALMAGQRGAGSNAGLIARQAAQQGSGIQQQAAGQAAVNRLQQQLSTQGLLGNVYGNIGNQAAQNLSTQQQALQNQNALLSGNTLRTNEINAGIGMDNTKNRMGQLSGIGQSMSGMLTPTAPTTPKGAEGGLVKTDGFQSNPDDHLHHIAQIYHPHMSKPAYAKGGKVDALVSPGEIFLKPDKVEKVAEGKANPVKIGEKIPGKPKVPGAVDSYANDTVPKKLEEGGIVIPRHVTQSADPVGESMKFVKAVLAKKRHGAK